MTDGTQEREAEYWGLTNCRLRVEGDLYGSSYTNTFIVTQTGIQTFSLNFTLAFYAMLFEMAPTWVAFLGRQMVTVPRRKGKSKKD